MTLLLILLQVNTPPVSDTVEIIKAIGAVIGIIGGILSPFILYYVSKMKGEVGVVKGDVDAVKKSINGLLEQKSKAERALGVLEGIEDAEKADAIGNKRELQILKEQALKNEIPASQQNRDSDLKKAEDKIVETLETQIHKKGEEMKKVVENKSDQIKDEVEKVPDEVVKKLPPK